MTPTAIQQLAQRIADQLCEAGHVVADRKDAIANSLATGTLSQDDWREEIERKLQADDAETLAKLWE
jgi:hypothetical protein